MKFNTILILIGILFSVVLIIENMIVPLNAYVLIWISKTWVLAITCILTGIVLGYGIRGKMSEQEPSEDDTYGF